MTFTYGMDLANTPRDRIRFEIGDTGEKDEAGNVIGYFLEDEEITALYAIHSSNLGRTVIACINAIIAKLSRPTFQADWLRVDNKVALDSYRKLLSDKENEFAVNDSGSYWLDDTAVDVSRNDTFFDPDDLFPDG